MLVLCHAPEGDYPLTGDDHILSFPGRPISDLCGYHVGGYRDTLQNKCNQPRTSG